MAKGVIDTLLDQFFDAEWKGRYGEKLTERELKWVKRFGRDGEVLRNVYVPKPDGETSEIDVMFITQKGIFVIESKNYSGWIFGSEADRNWTVSLPGGHKEHFYNPILQNKGHIKWLREFLGDDIPLFSLIVFSERCELKKVVITKKDALVIKRDRLYATVRSLWDDASDVLGAAKVEGLYRKLLPLANATEAEKAAHVAVIQKKYARSESVAKNTDPPKATSPNDDALTCPRCGAPLVLRTARKGINAGNQFYGCSAFPKCRYTRSSQT